MERESIIGIKVVNYSSFADIVKIMRKYDKCSLAEIKTRVQDYDYVLTCNYIDEEGLEELIKCYKELVAKGVEVEIYEHGRLTNLQFLKNLSNTYAEIANETDVEIELEEADMARLLPYEYLWTTEQADWVVLKDKHGYSIINKTTHMFFLVEDDDLNNQIGAMMIMAGNKVIADIKELVWNE